MSFAENQLTERLIYNKISWNKDSSRINWHIKDQLLRENYHYHYFFDGKELKTYSRHKLIQETEYKEFNNAFETLIKDELENNAFCSSYLLGFDKLNL